MSKGILLFFILARISGRIIAQNTEMLKVFSTQGNKSGKTALFFL
jgi:hypothetical protein